MYTGTLVWGVTAKDKLPPIHVENAFPAIVSREEYDRVASVMQANAPDKQHPQRTASPYLLSGLAECSESGKSLIGQEAKSGQYAYYVCHSLLKRRKGTCDTPRLSARRFERTIIDQIRVNVLTDSNMKTLVESSMKSWTRCFRNRKNGLRRWRKSCLRSGGAWTGSGTPLRPPTWKSTTSSRVYRNTRSVRKNWSWPQRKPGGSGKPSGALGRCKDCGLRARDGRFSHAERAYGDQSLHPVFRKGDSGRAGPSNRPLRDAHAGGQSDREEGIRGSQNRGAGSGYST